MPCSGPTVAARFDPPSFREPVARRSTPLARAIKYGNEIDASRYVMAIATASSIRIAYGRRARPGGLEQRGDRLRGEAETDYGDDERGRGRQGAQAPRRRG